MDLPSIAPAISKLLEQSVFTVVLIYVCVTLYKKVMEVQDKRVYESIEREKTVTIALNTVTQNIASTDSTLKAILITLEKNNGKN